MEHAQNGSRFEHAYQEADERLINEADQLALISRGDCYAELDTDQKRDLRAHMAQIVMANLAIMQELTDQMVADGEEAKSRRKRLSLPEHWMRDGDFKLRSVTE